MRIFVVTVYGNNIPGLELEALERARVLFGNDAEPEISSDYSIEECPALIARERGGRFFAKISVRDAKDEAQ